MKRHAFDPISFIFGIVFVGLAVAGVASTTTDFDFQAWIIPGAVLLFGVGLLLVALRGLRSPS
ncbi:MAG: hypothetical protein DWP92_03965 [Armatimonadetes bacterium]|nr:MAG: hypothetical protein DWP92_03965 [Armatimonadota bacterium]